MKKVLIGFLLLFTLATKVSAQEREVTQVKYWYYPAQNIYYNDVSGDYWYYDVPSQAWITVKTLPTTYTITPTDERYVVYYNGPDVWKANKQHKVKYKVKHGKATKTAAY